MRTMKIDRLFGILTTLLQRDFVTAPFLAEKFEVTRRTIGRDIDALCQAGIPVATRQGKGGGISIESGYKLDKSVLTKNELSDVLAVLRGISSVSKKGQMDVLIDKLSPSKEAMVSLRESVVIDLASHYKGSLTTKIELIKQAISEQKLIEFDYYSESGEMHRRIEPYFIAFQWAAWYVFGFCSMRNDWRMFKLTRLWELVPSEETYSLRTIPPEKTEFNSHFKDNKKLVALFDSSAKYQLIECYGLDCFKETKDGKLLFETGYISKAYTISWLLGFGDKVKLLEPPEMVDEIREIAKKIFQEYEKT